ncbi:MAG: ExbD/TolR family protein [Chthoniobacterales bacterium]
MKINLQNLIKASKNDEEFNMSSMIDIVFLLLIYFIVTTTLKKTEADLGFQLPGSIVQNKTLKMPDEQIIEISADGSITLNSMTFDADGDPQMPELTTTLKKFRQISEDTKNPVMVTIQADEEARHQRIIDAMNSCANAGIKNITFGN